MASFTCPYDDQYCEEFFKDLLSFQRYVHDLMTTNSDKLFFDPGNSFDRVCPLDYARRAKCVRYQIWKKKHPNER